MSKLKRKPINWDKQPLGTIPDQELGEKLGYSNSQVFRERTKRKIPSYAECFAIDWDTQPLGKVNDYELAKQLGCSSASVFTQRTKRGIQAYTKSLTDWKKQPFGKMSDCDIAQKLGCGSSAVRYQRHKRNIGPFSKPSHFDFKTSVASDAWAAGMIDADGCITIKKSTRNANVNYVLCVILAQVGTDKRPAPGVLELCSLYGGSISGPTKRLRRSRPMWHWLVASAQAEQVLNRLSKYLVVKRDQAEVGLEFRRLFKNIQRINRKKAEKFYQILRKLKKK